MILPNAYKGHEQSWVKHYFLENYLERVLWDTLASPNSLYNEFVFVDGFAGPWQLNEQDYKYTSFLRAIAKLRKVKEALTAKGRQITMRAIFVEKSERYSELEKSVKEIKDIKIDTLKGEFEENITNISNLIGNSSSTFVLTFVDPTGWSVDLDAISSFLKRPSNEVIYNFMYSFIRRFPDHPDEKIRKSYDLPLGKDWQNKLNKELSFDKAVLELFQYRLKISGNYKYVPKLEILKPTVDATHFFLYYGTRNRKGLIEFRGVQRKTLHEQNELRHATKGQTRESRTGQPDFLHKAGLDHSNDDEKHHTEQITFAKKHLKQLLQSRRFILFWEITDILLEKFEVTQPDVNRLVLDGQKCGSLIIEGMPPRARVPRDDCKIFWRDKE